MDFELYINWGVVGIIVLIALVIALLAANIKVVPQAHAFVIERLGAYHATWSTGLHLKIPFIDRIAKKVSLKEQVIDFPPQPVITKDNVTMQIDTVDISRSRTRSCMLTAWSARSPRLRTFPQRR